MVGEKDLGSEGAYLGRFGALCMSACGACTVLAALLLVLEPSAGNAAALVVSAAVTAGGVLLARRG